MLYSSYSTLVSYVRGKQVGRRYCGGRADGRTGGPPWWSDAAWEFRSVLEVSRKGACWFGRRHGALLFRQSCSVLRIRFVCRLGNSKSLLVRGTDTSASGKMTRRSTRRRRVPAAFTTAPTVPSAPSKATSSGVSCGASTSSA